MDDFLHSAYNSRFLIRGTQNFSKEKFTSINKNADQMETKQRSGGKVLPTFPNVPNVIFLIENLKLLSC